MSGRLNCRGTVQRGILDGGDNPPAHRSGEAGISPSGASVTHRVSKHRCRLGPKADVNKKVGSIIGPRPLPSTGRRPRREGRGQGVLRARQSPGQRPTTSTQARGSPSGLQMASKHWLRLFPEAARAARKGASDVCNPLAGAGPATHGPHTGDAATPVPVALVALCLLLVGARQPRRWRRLGRSRP